MVRTYISTFIPLPGCRSTSLGPRKSPLSILPASRCRFSLCTHAHTHLSLSLSLSIFLPPSLFLSRKYSDLRDPALRIHRALAKHALGAPRRRPRVIIDPCRRRCAAVDDGAGARALRQPGCVPATRSPLSEWKCIT